jgi:UDP-glucose 4-epimerase
MRIAIVGCKGFLGATFAEVAAARGHALLGIARSSQPDPGFPGAFLAADAAHSDLAPALRGFGPDLVLHAAGTASVGASLGAPLDDLRASVMTFANTLDAVRRAGVRSLVLFPSSAAVYGNPAALPVAEDAPLVPVSPYGFHKLACELLAREYAELYGLRVAVARLFSLYGSRQRRLLLWELFTQAAGEGPEVVVGGSGRESRDYLHAEDACAALLDVAAAAGPGLSVVNVASGEETRVEELAKLVVQTVAPGKRLVFRGETRAGDPAHWRADVRRLSLLGSAPPRPLARGVEECLRRWTGR